MPKFSLIGIATGDEGMAMKYGLKADSIKTLYAVQG